MYGILKFFIGFFLNQFFAEIRVGGAKKIEEGPLLVVVNHPNLAMDSLLVAKSFKRDLWFLAKSTLFTNKFLSKFFESCHMIPIARRQDNSEMKIDNREIFDKVVDILSQGKAVAIFPEGVSSGERQLQPLKTGAARIAFQSEEVRNFTLSLKIQAVGLTYSKISTFKSRATLTFGEPIAVSDFQKIYESDAQAAVKLLTERIALELKNLTVQIEKQEHGDLLEKITQIYKSRDSLLDDRQVMTEIADNMRQLNESDWEKAKDLIKRIDLYNHLASLFSLDGLFVTDKSINKYITFLSLPLFFAAYLLNIIPYRLVGYFAGQDKETSVHAASSKFGYGILIFSLCYISLSILAAIIFKSFWVFFLALILCLSSGYLLSKYMDHVKILLITSLWPSRKKPFDLLIMIRDELINDLNLFRKK